MRSLASTVITACLVAQNYICVSANEDNSHKPNGKKLKEESRKRRGSYQGVLDSSKRESEEIRDGPLQEDEEYWRRFLQASSLSNSFPPCKIEVSIDVNIFSTSVNTNTLTKLLFLFINDNFSCLCNVKQQMEPPLTAMLSLLPKRLMIVQ